MTSPDSKSNDVLCPVCETGHSVFHARIDGYDYFRCQQCASLHIDNDTVDAIDAGHSTRIYDESYWVDELKAARERAAGEALVRVGEAILYARRPVCRFLDVGAGPGYLLDALAERFPLHKMTFHGVELFPPDEHSSHPNYRIGKVGDLTGTFDAGVCIEVVEHLTPRMLAGLASELAKISAPRTLWLFNTGMPEMVLGPDPGYLDPLRRGHIVSYGLAGIRHIFEPHGFRVSQVPGKNHAWVAEFECEEGAPNFEGRVSELVPENTLLLMECPLVYQAAYESARASLNLHLMQERSRWATAMEAELSTARAAHSALQTEHEDVAKWAHRLRDELSELKDQYVSLQTEHEDVAKWAHRLRDELSELKDQYVSLQTEHEDVAKWAHQLQNELSQLKSHYISLHADHARVLGSRSWKFTRPLRELNVLFRRCLGVNHRSKNGNPSDHARD